MIIYLMHNNQVMYINMKLSVISWIHEQEVKQVSFLKNDEVIQTFFQKFDVKIHYTVQHNILSI